MEYATVERKSSKAHTAQLFGKEKDNCDVNLSSQKSCGRLRRIEFLMKHEQHTTHIYEHEKLRVIEVKNGHDFEI